MALRKYGWQVDRFRDPFSDQKILLGQSNVRVIFDCGANEGQTAISYQSVFPNAAIYSFEASPEIYDRLARRSLSNVKGALRPDIRTAALLSRNRCFAQQVRISTFSVL